MTADQPGSDPEAFLIAEYETIPELRSAHNTLVAAEFSIFVAMATAVFVALAFLSERFEGEASDLLTFSAAVMAILALLGWAIFDRVVRSRVQVVEYARHLNRIRRYFVERHPDIAPFVGARPCDTLPRFGAIGGDHPWFPSGNTGLISIVNSAVVAALAGVLLALVSDNHELTPRLSAACTLVFLVSLAVHHQYQNRKCGHAELAWTATFPCD